MNHVNVRTFTCLMLLVATLLAIAPFSGSIPSDAYAADANGIGSEGSDDVPALSSDPFIFQFTVGVLRFSVLNDDEVSVASCEPLGVDTIIIPSTVTSPSGKEYNVVEIGKRAFMMGLGLESVTIPDTVKRIGKEAFMDRGGLVSLSIPIDIHCEKDAFKNVGVEHLTLTKGATGTSQDEFWKSWKDSIETLTVGEGIFEFGASFDWDRPFSVTLKDVQEIHKDQFSGCGLLEIHAPNVRVIGERAFKNCPSLEVLDLGSVTTIGKGAFHGCPSISSVTGNVIMSDNLLFIPIDDWRASVVQCIGNGKRDQKIPTVVDAEPFKRYVVTAIGEETFVGCSDLSIVRIPDSILDIGRHAFKGCDSIDVLMVPIGASCCYGTDDFAFKGVEPSTLFLTRGGYDPDTYTDNEFWKPWASNIKALTIESGITEFGTSFKKSDLLSVTLKDVREIRKDQFRECERLWEVSAPNVEIIGDHAFQNCHWLRTLHFNSVSTLGKGAFNGCDKVFFVTGNMFMSGNVMYLQTDDRVVSAVHCTGEAPEALLIPETVTDISSGKTYTVTAIWAEAFMDRSDITSFIIPNSVLEIGENAFRGCTSVDLLSVPIGAKCGYQTSGFAFRDMEPSVLILTGGGYDPDTYMDNEFWKPWTSSIKALNVTIGITQFETSFRNTGLSILMMNDVHTVQKDQFKDCDKLIGVSVTGARYIGESAFRNCESLLKVTCGNLKVVGTSSFKDCSSLREFTATNVGIINEKAFYKCKALESFPFIGTTRIDSKAFYETYVPAPVCSLLGSSGIDIADDAFRTVKPSQDEKDWMLYGLLGGIFFVVLAVSAAGKVCANVAATVFTFDIPGLIACLVACVEEIYMYVKMCIEIENRKPWLDPDPDAPYIPI